MQILLFRLGSKVIRRIIARETDQLECTDPARNDFWELAGSLPVNARSRGRLGLRLGLLYSRKATALAGAECGARGVEPGLIRPETR